MKNLKTSFALLLTLLLLITLSVSSITTVDTYAASKKYTKTYSLKRNYKKTVKLKSTIKTIKTSNKKVATVKKSGKKFTITTKKKGTAIITVKCKNKKIYRYKVKVSNKKHKHAWTTEDWTETVTTQIQVEYIVCNSCKAEYNSIDEVKAHQATTGWDGDYAHTGWHNDWKTVDVVTTVTHHRRVCGCGAVENID